MGDRDCRQASACLLCSSSPALTGQAATSVLCLLLQVLSDWDRFARGEYLRLAVEEEPDDMQVDAADDMWSNGRGAGSKMLLEDVDADDDLLPAAVGAGGPAGAGGTPVGDGMADLLPGEEGSGAAAMDASS